MPIGPAGFEGPGTRHLLEDPPLDNLDGMILRELMWRPSDPLHAARGLRRTWDIARAVGLHGTTVKRRIAEMRDSGLLRGIYLQPEPSLAGLRAHEHHLTYPNAAAKREAYATMMEDPAVWEVYSIVGDDLIAVLATPEGEDARLASDRVARATGAIASRYHHEEAWPVPIEKISALDLRILAAYAGDAMRSVSDVAREVGVSAKTITTRMKALARQRAFLVDPVVDASRMQGGMTVYLDLEMDLGASAAVHAEIPNRFPLALCRSSRAAENGYILIAAVGSTDVEEMIQRAQGIPGVKRVAMKIMHDTHHEPTRWRNALLARAEELARAKGVWLPPWRARPDALVAPRE